MPERDNAHPSPPHDAEADVVVLVHGLARTWRCMRPLARRLSAEGFQPRHFEYHSIRWSIGQNAASLLAFIEQLESELPRANIHFVTHSLGGILVRCVLELRSPHRLGRVVMLAPPNRGSRMARHLAPLFGWCVKPLRDLSDDPESFVCRLPFDARYELGIIAARKDGKVRIPDTHLDREADHLVVPGYHTFLMNRRDVQAQTIAFLQEGRFHHGRP